VGYPGQGGGLWLRMIFPSGLRNLAGAVGMHGQRPAHLVQHHVVVPPAVAFQAGQAGAAAVGPVDHMMGFAAGGRHAERRGWRVVARFKDDGYSAFKEIRRDDFVNLIEAIERDEIDVVIHPRCGPADA
jgi:Resolvase, N terminal domain